MKTYIDISGDERWLDGNVPLRILERDTLTGTDAAIEIGDEVELVLSVRQAITFFDLLDGWLNGAPVKVVGGVERRVLDAIKMTVDEHGALIRAMNERQEELAHVLYENMRFKGLRFRMSGDDREADDTVSKRARKFTEKKP